MFAITPKNQGTSSVLVFLLTLYTKLVLLKQNYVYDDQGRSGGMKFLNGSKIYFLPVKCVCNPPTLYTKNSNSGYFFYVDYPSPPF